MPYSQRKRKRRYHLKPVPIVTALLVVIAAIAGVIFLFSKGKDEIKDNKSSDPTSVFSSMPSSLPSNDQSSLPASEPSSNDSLTQSSDETVSDTPIKNSSVPTTSKESPSAPSPTSVDVPDVIPTGEWNMILVNKDTPTLTKDLAFEKTKFDSQYVDSRAAGAYSDMYNAAKAEGITLYLRSGYRSISEQKANYNASVNRYMKDGKSQEEATLLTDQYYTKPGQSEHHTGLAFDIITPEYHNDIRTLDDRFAETEAYKWLVKNCASYGFILRYPKDKVDITKINYEPWHYRYVGVEMSNFITKNGMCLEECFSE